MRNPPGDGAPRWSVQVAAALAIISAALHVGVVSAGQLAGWAMAAMAWACLYCAWHLWRRPSARVWGLTAAMDAGMLVLHVPMLFDGHGAMTLHVHGPATSTGGTAPLMLLGLGVVLTQFAISGWAVWVTASVTAGAVHPAPDRSPAWRTAYLTPDCPTPDRSVR